MLLYSFTLVNDQCYKTFYSRKCIAIGITQSVIEKYNTCGVITAVKVYNIGCRSIQ
jgi:hypothetical protein